MNSPRRAAAFGTDLLNDNLTFGATLQLRPYVTLPASTKTIISMTTRPGDSRLYVTTQQGKLYAVTDNGNGTTTPSVYFDASAALTSQGITLEQNNPMQHGLQSIAFHPDFATVGAPGYGKIYATMVVRRTGSGAGLNFLGDTVRGATVTDDTVLAEWTYNFNANQVDASSYRELFRVNMPKDDHPIKQAKFDPYARPGDADFGLLYLTHGDSNEQNSPNDDPQHLGNVLGKMLRINPLASGSDRYTIPADNPFASSSDPGVLKEIYAYGLRNPHTYSFNRDDQGNIRILAGDIGRQNVEEINVVTPGGNYGWPKREGTFVQPQNPDGAANSGYLTGVSPLPADEATVGVDALGNRYIYPVAMYDHNGANVTAANQLNTGTSLASGFVIKNTSDPALYNQLILSNFANQNGFAYQMDFNAALGSVTQLDPENPDLNAPGDLTHAALERVHLALDQDKNPGTPPQMFDDFNQLVGSGRNDTRYGEGNLGEMYISSKANGVVYLVTNSLPLFGDYDKNFKVDGDDLTAWENQLGQTGYLLNGDGNGDGVVDGADFLVWQRNLGNVAATSPAGASVPEPDGALLAAAAIAGWAVRRRRTAVGG